ncbi:MAG: PHP domain-containing protein [Clostridia bacterium]|nr:PHP domain-containing protein [Clostridia bacterium]
MYKYEMHLHTSEGDNYADFSGAECVKMYRDAGYAGMVVTNHYEPRFFEWYADELKGADHRGIIDRFLRGYYNARNEGEKLGFTVLAGAEVRFTDSENDYLVYGVDEDFFYKAPLLHLLDGPKGLIDILPQGACVVQAHPFRNNMTVRDPGILFGVEAYNGEMEPFRNVMAKTFAAYYTKPMTSGSDFHVAEDFAKGGIATARRITTPAELCDLLRSGDYELIEG